MPTSDRFQVGGGPAVRGSLLSLGEGSVGGKASSTALPPPACRLASTACIGSDSFYGRHATYCPETLLAAVSLPQGLKCLYPPGGGPGAVEVTHLDLPRLDAEEFLNDTVIDFYVR